MTKRNVTLFRDLPDISAVTYPCSTSTSIEVARRMAMEIPVESRARLRRLYVETRAGAMLNAANKGHLTDVVKTLHQVLGAAGVDPASLIDDPPDDSTEPDEQELDRGDDSQGGTTEDGTQGGNSVPSGGNSTAAGDALRSDDPGDDPIRYRKTSRNLRLELELRKRRRLPAGRP